VGPDLSHIGSVRSPRDLLEAIGYPSATFARTFEPYTVKLKDGTIEAGIIARESGNTLFLTTGPRSTKRIPRPQIADVRPSQISIMPQGLDAQLSREELADLVAFLASLK
jgi:putative heme-binding domain-containing protein